MSMPQNSRFIFFVITFLCVCTVLKPNNATSSIAVNDFNATWIIADNIKLKPVAANASSTHPASSPSKLIDGKKSGYANWISLAQHKDDIIWSSIDLGKTKMINKVCLTPSMNWYLFPPNFTIEVSNDNSNWTVVINETDYAAKPEPYTKIFPVQSARYVRIKGKGVKHQGTWGWFISLYEFEVFAQGILPKLTWTATGANGKVASYEIRHTTSGLINSKATWNAASSANGKLTPQTAGSKEQLILNNGIVSSDNINYFSLKSYDSLGKESALSNSAKLPGGLINIIPQANVIYCTKYSLHAFALAPDLAEWEWRTGSNTTPGNSSKQIAMTENVSMYDFKTPGTHYIWLRAKKDNVEWGTWVSVRIDVKKHDQKSITLVSPSGKLADPTPEFTFKKKKEVTHYRIYVYSDDGNLSLDSKWLPVAALIKKGNTFSWKSPYVVSKGHCSWRVNSKHGSVESPLSLPMYFDNDLNNKTMVLPSVFANNMVLQRNKPLPVWGWAKPKEKITVTFAEESIITTAGEDGKWILRLSPKKASKIGLNFIVRSSASEPIIIKNVIVGDVWLTGGQSNMSAAGTKNSVTRFDSLIRNFRVMITSMNTIPKEAGGYWQTEGAVTTIGFDFAKELYKKINVPIGLIDSSISGSNIHVWMPHVTETTWNSYFPSELQSSPNANYRLLASGNYNAMVAPFAPFAITGAIWYQGEANAKGEHMTYAYKFKRMIEGWRKAWQQDNFPFYYVQLCTANKVIEKETDILDNKELKKLEENYTNKSFYGAPLIREAQTKLLDLGLKNIGMAVTIELGNDEKLANIHPRNKDQISRRLAYLALANTYGLNNITSVGPFYKSHKIEGNTIRVTFDHVGEGLITQNHSTTPAGTGENVTPAGFHIMSGDGRWHFGNATIDGNTIVVSKEGVTNPVHIRYAFENNSWKCNIYSKNGLPLAPFRTDGKK